MAATLTRLRHFFQFPNQPTCLNRSQLATGFPWGDRLTPPPDKKTDATFAAEPEPEPAENSHSEIDTATNVAPDVFPGMLLRNSGMVFCFLAGKRTLIGVVFISPACPVPDANRLLPPPDKFGLVFETLPPFGNLLVGNACL
ncbi:MAG: hypothetical protein O3C34_12570 [Proteobacteria bacterium]|nr:hypothetical protein [Pseudomonadota bacterium]